MKTLEVTIKARFIIPEHWHIRRFRYNDRGDELPVVRADDHDCFFTIKILADHFRTPVTGTPVERRWLKRMTNETCVIVD